MKRILVLILSFSILFGFTVACSSDNIINKVMTIDSNAEYHTSQYGNSNGNIVNGGYALMVDNNLLVNDNYIPSHSMLYKYEPKIQFLESIFEDCNGSLNFYGNKLYYTSEQGIVGSDLDGNNLNVYYDKPCPFIIFDSKIYLTDSNVFCVDLCTRDTMSLNNIFSEDINVSNNKIYYISKDNMAIDRIEELEREDLWGSFGEIYQMNLDGSDNVKIYSNSVFNLIYYEGFLYYIERNSLTIGKIDIISKESEIISENVYHNFNINKEQLICSNSSSIDILDLDGNLIRRFELEGIRDTRFNVVDNYIFFRKFGSNKIQMIDLTTSELKTIIEE